MISCPGRDSYYWYFIGCSALLWNIGTYYIKKTLKKPNKQMQQIPLQNISHLKKVDFLSFVVIAMTSGAASE